MAKKDQNRFKKTALLFFGVAVVWLILALGVGFVWCLSGDGIRSLIWLTIFWFLSVLDLAVLAVLVKNIFEWMNAKGENRPVYAIRTLCWGIFKVFCLGLFFIVLLKGQQIPMQGLLLGMGTLVIVPLVGGFLWSQKVLSNA